MWGDKRREGVKKCVKIGDVVYGWPLNLFLDFFKRIKKFHQIRKYVLIDLKKTLFGVFSNDNQYGHQYGDKILLIHKDITTCKQTADLWSKIFRLIFIVYAKLNNLATQNGDKYVYLSKQDQMEQMADKSNPKKRELSSLTLKKQKKYISRHFLDISRWML